MYSYPEARQPAGLRILVVDDNEDAADSLALILKLMGHKVCVTYDGLTALKVASAFQPQVVLLDLGLPKMDGNQVARHLREQAALRDTLLIATTGFGGDDDRRRCREAGFDHFLLKPFESIELTELLAAHRQEKSPVATLQ